jgi:nucleotide-binding universal stress UspA family protein
MQILIVTAGTPYCEAAVLLGARIGTQTPSALTLLTVVRNKSKRNLGEAILDQSCALLEEEGVVGEARLRVGQPAREILVEAAVSGCNIIVMGMRPWHPRLRRLLGVTSQDVLTRAACPVLVTKGDSQLPERILICDSGATSPRLVEGFVQRFPGLLKTSSLVTILHVMSQISAGPGVRGWQLRANSEALQEIDTPEGHLLAVDERVLEYAGIPHQARIRHGMVVDEILLEAEEGAYDLVVIGAHQKGGWQDLLLDDLAQQIIARLDCPVLVMR